MLSSSEPLLVLVPYFHLFAAHPASVEHPASKFWVAVVVAAAFGSGFAYYPCYPSSDRCLNLWVPDLMKMISFALLLLIMARKK